MAITSVTRVWAGETWSDEKLGAREYVEQYRVITNDALTSPVAVRADSRLPQIGDYYANDPAARCSGRTCTREDGSRLIWNVTATYEWQPSEEDDVPENPLAEPVKIRWTASQYTKPIAKDINGEAIVNSAGDYFDPPPEAEDVRWQVNAQANYAFVPSGILGLAGAVNSSAFSIDGVLVPPETARIVGLDIGERQYAGEISYRTVTMVLEFRSEGFDLSLLDQGYRIKDGTDLVDILIEDEDGNQSRPTSPVLLNGSGAKLSDPSPSAAQFLDFEVTNKVAFSGLPGVVG